VNTTQTINLDQGTREQSFRIDIGPANRTVIVCIKMRATWKASFSGSLCTHKGWNVAEIIAQPFPHGSG
jgi:hypothetical protein